MALNFEILKGKLYFKTTYWTIICRYARNSVQSFLIKTFAFWSFDSFNNYSINTFCLIKIYQNAFIIIPIGCQIIFHNHNLYYFSYFTMHILYQNQNQSKILKKLFIYYYYIYNIGLITYISILSVCLFVVANTNYSYDCWFDYNENR